MAILNLGSINLDLVYQVPRIPAPGETLAATGVARFLGGKGANMSVAAARAGGQVRHFGAVGPDGAWALDALGEAGVDCAGVLRLDAPTGQAVILVDRAGQNAITLLAGANRAMPAAIVDALLDRARPGDWLLLQNEAAHGPEAAARARAAGLRVAYAAAPFEADAVGALRGHVDLLAVNAVEATQLRDAFGASAAELGVETVLVTRGSDGADLHRRGMPTLHQAALPVADVVDTTGAGDTFLGVLLGRLDRGDGAEAALGRAAAAAAIAVTRPGAAGAIPDLAEIDARLAAAS